MSRARAMQARRIVIKVGTSLLASAQLDYRRSERGDGFAEDQRFLVERVLGVALERDDAIPDGETVRRRHEIGVPRVLRGDDRLTEGHGLGEGETHVYADIQALPT